MGPFSMKSIFDEVSYVPLKLLSARMNLDVYPFTIIHNIKFVSCLVLFTERL